MSDLKDIFNPVEYLYLNPELYLRSNLNNVEEIINYYTNYGSNNLPYNPLVLPNGYNTKIYIQRNDSIIKEDLPELYDIYKTQDPERLAIIHYDRYKNKQLAYKIQEDFKLEIYKQFNDVTLDYLMPTEHYLDYLIRSNLLNTTSNLNINVSNSNNSNIVLGTISDFMINILTRKFEEGYFINSDLIVSKTLTTSNLDVTGKTSIGYITAKDLQVSNLTVDTLSVVNTSFVETLFQDGVRLTNNLIVEGSNSVFKKDVKINNLAVDDTSLFNNDVKFNTNINVSGNTVLSNLTVNKNSEFNNSVVFNSNVSISGFDTSFSNTVKIEHLIIDKTLAVSNTAIFNDDVTFKNNISVNSNLSVDGAFYLNNKAVMSNSVKILNSLEVSDDVTIYDSLKVSNMLQVSNDVYLSNNLNVAKTITATEYITLSDKRLKNNICNYDLQKAKHIINNLVVKEYNLLDSKETSVGLIAQDVEQISNNFLNIVDNYDIDLDNKSIYLRLLNANNKQIYINNGFNDGDILTYSYISNHLEVGASNTIYKGKISGLSSNAIFLEPLNQLQIPVHDMIVVKTRTITKVKAVNYMELMMLSICCLQDLTKRIEKIENSLST